MSYEIWWTKTAQKDLNKIKQKETLYKKLIALLKILQEDPYASPPSFEKLAGDLKGLCSRRINIQHRLIYEILTKENKIKILTCWTHYE
jgi:Txe/YoeB family toxin of toxin-antitoxin system